MWLSRWLLATAAAGTAAGLLLVPANAGAADHLTWQEDLNARTAVRVNVTDGPPVTVADSTVRLGTDARSAGLVVAAAHDLARSVNWVQVRVAGSHVDQVGVEVRGRGPDGRWSEWYEVRDPAASFAQPATTVQLRLSLVVDAGTAPTVSAVSVEAALDRSRAAPATAPVRAQAFTYRVFATREGLVGGRTANGHIIVGRDHFVALPSRRGLNPVSGGHDYQVQVCYARTGRCETAPVWDVGPWNTRDDYWNPSATRQMWKDLPQGRPEAQAAKLEGYNGGRDQFGRVVANPAGIDLADGTFWDGLGMVDNDWVDVTYLWT